LRATDGRGACCGLSRQCADYERLLAACAEHEVPVVEDAAEALGATYHERPAGSFGAVGVLSFNGNKIITTSGGGALVTERPEWAEEARFLAAQAGYPAPITSTPTLATTTGFLTC
jgi:dTDP-4-amino-4,6-dideoxygalactose transaminase